MEKNRKHAFRKRNSSGQVEAPPECDKHAELNSNPDTLSMARPHFQQTFSADSVSPNGFRETRQSQMGQVGSHAPSPANSLLPFGGKQRGGSSDVQLQDFLGLRLLCDNIEPEGDIIFVHGLGGTPVTTWSWKGDVSNFWPVWLTEEQGLSNFRIFSFGYNSDFRGAGTNLNTTDFAKDLLYSMLTFSGGSGAGADEQKPIGSKPIIFVAHSMGGLVVKKAHILGKQDKTYSDLIAQVYGIVFLATPHRGANYAKLLNNILATCPLGAPPKAYLAELDIYSGSLQDINEQFRVCCENLELASFYETQKTSFAVTKILTEVVKKVSGILGYPQEISMPLNADHHSICKFENREDANYIRVKNTLRHWSSHFLRPPRPDTLEHWSSRSRSPSRPDTLEHWSSRSRSPSRPDTLEHWSSQSRSPSRPDIFARGRSSNAEIKHLQSILSIQESPETDLKVLQNRVLEGTCLWITARHDFVAWVEASESKIPGLFWLVGLPGTGKTSLAKSVIGHLQSLGHECFHHFFSSGHQVKRTAAYCLRSLAFQIALANDDFRERLCDLVQDSRIKFDSQNFGVVWEKIFEGILFKLSIRKPIFLVLDGIDEADFGPVIVAQLLKIQSKIPLKFFLTSRPMKIPSASERSSSSLTTFFLREEDTLDDISAYVQDFVQKALLDDSEFQKNISSQVLAKASGSFLWVKLALDTLQDNWHTKEDIQRALTEVPNGMELLYQRMLDTIKAQSLRLQLMAKRILTWAVCCWRPLSITELQVALQSEFHDFVRLEHTIVQICGHFISVVDSRISVVHATARSFLLLGTDNEHPFIDPRQGHQHLAIMSLKYLSNDRWRRTFKDIEMSTKRFATKSRQNRLLLAEKSHPLLSYATYFWAYHVSKSAAGAQELMLILKAFLANHVLSWIEGIALSNNLRHLTDSAQYLKAYAKKQLQGSNFDPHDDIILSPRKSLKEDTELQSWANDFIHIVGKFGRNLVQSPSSIYRLIPPLCPRTSMISATYGNFRDQCLSIAGLTSEGWGDCLASVTVAEQVEASRVLATDAYFITLICTSGTVVIWHAEICEEARRMHHGEYVPMMALNRSGTRLATAATLTYRIWDINTGTELYCLRNSSEAVTMTIAFGSTDSQLLVGRDDCSVTHYDLETSSMISRFEARDSLQKLQGCPRLMAISPNSQKVAVAWRGKPLSIWDMNETLPPQRYRVSGSSDPVNDPELVIWQNDGNSILILCLNSKIVEWDLYNEDQTGSGKYHDIAAREMTVSADGNFLLTSDNVGTMSVWMFPNLQLIYRLLNGNECIYDIAFSPNGQRFYDTRESMCNVWEPDALVRPDEGDLEDTSNIAESYTATEAVISHDESSRNQVTAFSAGPNDQYHCCGKEDGSVVIYESTEGKKLRTVSNHAPTSSVISLKWSQSGRCIVSSDDSGRIISKRLKLKERGKWAVFPVMNIRISEPVKQFVFSNDEELLLVSTPSKDFVWDLEAKREICSQSLRKSDGGRWVADPTNPKVLLCIDSEKVYSYTWDMLEISHIESHHASAVVDLTSGIEGRLRGVALTRDKRSLVYETVPINSVGGPQVSILSTSSLSHSWKIDILSGQVKRLVGTFRNAIVFLDHDYWICTWEIEAGRTDVKRHFFLPKDWLNTSTLQMATVNEEGTFFCPKFDSVIIVRNGIKI